MKQGTEEHRNFVKMYWLQEPRPQGQKTPRWRYGVNALCTKFRIEFNWLVKQMNSGFIAIPVSCRQCEEGKALVKSRAEFMQGWFRCESCRERDHAKMKAATHSERKEETSNKIEQIEVKEKETEQKKITKEQTIKPSFFRKQDRQGKDMGIFNSHQEFALYWFLKSLLSEISNQSYLKIEVIPNKALSTFMDFNEKNVNSDLCKYFLQASVDYLVVMMPTYKVLCAIEYNPLFTHNNDNSRRKDKMKRQILEDAKIPLFVIINSWDSLSIGEEMQRLLKELVDKSSAPRNLRDILDMNLYGINIRIKEHKHEENLSELMKDRDKCLGMRGYLK